MALSDAGRWDVSAIPITPLNGEDESDIYSMRRRGIPTMQEPDADAQGPSIPTQSAAPAIGQPAKPGIPTVQEANPTLPHKSALASLWTKADNIHNPFLRVLGKVGAGAARAIDTLASESNLGPSIPGTTANENFKAHQAQKQQDEQAKIAFENAQTSKAQAETEAIPAETELKKAQTEKLQKEPPEKPGNIEEQTFANLLTQPNPETGKPFTPIEAFQKVKQTAQDVKPDKPAGAEKLDQQYMDAISKGDTQTAQHILKVKHDLAVAGQAPQRPPQFSVILPSGEVHTARPGEVLPQGTQTPAGFSGQGKADLATKEKVLTYWQPTLDSAERFNVMAKNYRDGLKGDQQAMLSLLSNHLGMTMGLQKGARLNQAIINEAQQSLPWLQGLKAKFDSDGYLSGVVLSPEQMKQMLSLGAERYGEDVKKSRSMAGYVGATEEPPRKLSKDAAHFYLEASGNDPAKARAMAKEAGWSF
jgi:hypothetical protein